MPKFDCETYQISAPVADALQTLEEWWHLNRADPDAINLYPMRCIGFWHEQALRDARKAPYPDDVKMQDGSPVETATRPDFV